MTKDKILLEINDLHASINDIVILKGVNLKIYEGETHAIMGPNGSGKSTLSKVIAGHPNYKILKGEILFKGKDILKLEPEQRSHLGLFLGFQYPPEISGVTNEVFLRTAYNSKQLASNLPEVDPIEFFEIIMKKIKTLEINPIFLNRNLNEGFSGGEKKRNEILQLALLDSDFVILDEIDSGLDIDALKIISNNIKNIIDSNHKGFMLITHYQRLLNYIKPNFVHVMNGGKIIKTGNFDLVKQLEEYGYEWLK
jgi:Fe-S cluster assembly ATP-binding protein